jgi:hypothetical protein
MGRRAKKQAVSASVAVQAGSEQVLLVPFLHAMSPALSCSPSTVLGTHPFAVVPTAWYDTIDCHQEASKAVETLQMSLLLE